MPTPRKTSIVESLTEKLRRAKALVLMQTQGLNVAEQTDLRKKLRAGGMEFQVVKNTLFRNATHAAGVANVDEILNGPTSVAFGYEDEAAVAFKSRKVGPNVNAPLARLVDQHAGAQ